MIDSKIKGIIYILIATMAVIIAAPLFPSHVIIEPFSELGILGPDGIIADYPRTVLIGQNFKLNLFISDHEQTSSYYRVNIMYQLSGGSSSNNFQLQIGDESIIDSWDIFLLNDENRTIPLIISLKEPGANQRLIFELNKFIPETNTFVFKSRTQLLFNVTRVNN